MFFILSPVSKGGFTKKKIVVDPTNHKKTGDKSDQIKIDFCWFHVLFEGPTDTCRSAIGSFLIFFSDKKKPKKKKFMKPLNPVYQ